MTAAPVRPAQAISDKVPSGIGLVRRAPDPSLRPQSSIENLQIAGNRFAAQFLQAKLKVGRAGDRYEQEADRVAEQVTQTPSSSGDIPRIQKMCTGCEEELQREPTDQQCDEELRRQPRGADAPLVSPSLESDLRRLRNGGDPLPPSERGFFEPRFGRDFSQVRIHTGSEAARSARAVNALAFTAGSHIAFADGMYTPQTPAGQRLLAHELTHVVQQGHSLHRGSDVIQRQVPQAESPASDPAGKASFVVDDDAPRVETGQMRKSEFLSRLREEVCTESNAAMKGTGRTTDGCPYVDRWFGYYADKDSAYLERALRKFAPEASAATSATDYIPLVAARVKRSVEVWAQTGEITGVPDELVGAVMGGGILGAIGSAIGSVISGIGNVFRGIGRLLFKGKDGGANVTAGPSPGGPAVGGLNRGETLQSGVRSRMEGAFGRDFSSVRVHMDSSAAGMADRFHARALTVGSDIAFGAGEYQPGTPVGDALIAHELAHVVQQGGAQKAGAVPHLREVEPAGSRDSLEEEADVSAMTAVVRLWSGASSLADIGSRAMPRLRSGLRLQRCPKRTTPVTPREADRLIKDQFGANVAATIAAGVSAEGSDIKFVDEARFARAYECANKFYAEKGKTPDDTPVNQVIAFVDPHPLTPPRVYVCTSRRRPDTVLHEALHLYTSPQWQMPQRVNEGTTEYFTRRIADRQNLEIAGSYPCSYKAIASLVSVIREDPLQKAYFRGDVEGLKSAINKGRAADTFDNWVFKVALAEYERARGLIGLSEVSEC